MSQKLQGKTAIVTGGSRGIGYAISRSLLQAGASVVLCARNREAAEQAAEKLSQETGGRAWGAGADVSKQADIEMLFQFADRQLGKLDILINNAGVGVFSKVAELTPDQWRSVLDTNLTGAFLCTREAIRRMGNAGGGSIVNISSLAGKNVFAGGAAYNASKFGMRALTEATMLDHRHDNIRVSDIMPGSVDTEFGHSAKADWKIAPEDIADITMLILTAESRTLISRVEVRPSRPAK